MRITTLIEDTKIDGNLTEEFGLSLFVEANGKKILLDTGASSNFLKNSEALGINPKEIDFIIISHAHSDHGGGLQDILQVNEKATVYMHQSAAGDYYGNIGAKLPVFLNHFIHPIVNRSPFFSKYIGLDQETLKKYNNRIKLVTKPKEISKGIFLLTDIEKKYPLADGNKFLLVKKDGRLQLDDFAHEMVFVIREDDGIVVYSGCGHNGILNMVETVRAHFKDQAIKAIVGGFHLKSQPEKDNMAGTENDIEMIAKGLLNQDNCKIYTGHCTGNKAYRILERTLGDRIAPIYTGCSITV